MSYIYMFVIVKKSQNQQWVDSAECYLDGQSLIYKTIRCTSVSITAKLCSMFFHYHDAVNYC